ncbi:MULTISPECIES: translation initiation factor 2 [unclassified Streptomyces]|uniref:translation initiation factor 2 n=1 Tax=unclassified Streptomyces TaxID=2593676 RepID=UPI0035D65248
MALYRLLDALPALSGDDRITRYFTLVPGSDFGVDVFSAIEGVGGTLVPWDEARNRSYDLVLSASPKGDLRLLRGRHVLLPHGAGYNKSIPGEYSDSASGLDPDLLLREGDSSPVTLHAVAHPDQVARIAAVDPRAAERAKVVGDPTLERVLASRPLRERYRAALGTGSRRLLVLVSTWGPESLLRRQPDLPAKLAAQLSYDAHQLAMVIHPNEHSRLGTYELTERLAPALDAGMVLVRPHEEWASVLIAADALITDHGSTALYYCAAQDRPVVSAYEGGVELIPGTPMDQLLKRVPRLDSADSHSLEQALLGYRPGTAAEAAQAAFAHRGRALNLLRAELYSLLGMEPPGAPCPPRLLPRPLAAERAPTAFDVDADTTGHGIRVVRRPVGIGPPGHHLAAEHGAASQAFIHSAGLLYRRPLPVPAGQPGLSWTSDGWMRHALSAYPGCRSAAAILPSGLVLLRTCGHPDAYAVEVEPRDEGGRVTRIDPAAAASAVHAWLLHRSPAATAAPSRLSCVIGDRAHALVLRPATADEVAELF